MNTRRDPGAFGRGELSLSLSLGEDADRGAAAAARQGRQGVKGRLGAAELIDAGPTFSLRISLSQLKRWRSLSWIAERVASMLRPDQIFFAPMRPSSPRKRRPILSAWRQ